MSASEVVESIRFDVIGGYVLLAIVYFVVAVPAHAWPLLPSDVAGVVQGVLWISFAVAGAAVLLAVDEGELGEVGR